MAATQETFLGYARDLIEELSELARCSNYPTLHYILKIAAAEASRQEHRRSSETTFVSPCLEAGNELRVARQ